MDRQVLLLKFDHVSLLLRESLFDHETEDFAYVLEQVRKLLQLVEDFLAQSSPTQSDSPSPEATPVTESGDFMQDLSSEQRFGPFTASPASALQMALDAELPILPRNDEFEGVISPSTPASVGGSMSAYFDFTGYAREIQSEEGEAYFIQQREGSQNQVQDSQHEDSQHEDTQHQVQDIQCRTVDDNRDLLHVLAGDEDCPCSTYGTALHEDPNGATELAPSTASVDIGVQNDSTNNTTEQPNPCTSPPHQRSSTGYDQIQASSEGPWSTPQDSTYSRKRKWSDSSPSDLIVLSVTCPDLDAIVGKVADPSHIRKRLIEQAGDHASEIARINYLTRLFFHLGGPHAFQQLRDAFSLMCCTEPINCATIGGRIRALDRMTHAHSLEQRAMHVALYSDRAREQQRASDQGLSFPERAALHNMVMEAYPGLLVGVKSMKRRKGTYRAL